MWLWWWKSKLPAANLKLKTKTNQLDKNKKMNLKNKTYQLSGNATNSPDTGNIAAVIVSRVLNACNLRERAAALVDRLRMDCMHVVAHTCRFFFPPSCQTITVQHCFWERYAGPERGPGGVHAHNVVACNGKSGQRSVARGRRWFLATTRFLSGFKSPAGKKRTSCFKGKHKPGKCLRCLQAQDCQQSANGPGLDQPACFSLEFVQGLVVAAAGHL